jgi:aryl-alcohol dehydrogenase-like predicted oxidoreductase
MSAIVRTVKLGDRDVTRIGLGTNRLRNTPANIEFIRAAIASGIGMIDTAHMYTGGESEPTVGAALQRSQAKVVVASKGGYREDEGNPDVLRGQIDESLRRLRTECIDLYYLHRIHPPIPIEDSLRVIGAYHEQGKIRGVGISAVSVDQIERARRVLPITAVQNHYNLSHRDDDDVVDYCTEQSIVFVPYYPLQVEHSDLHSIAARHQVTAAQIALAWLLHRSPMMLPIPGTLSLAHVKENVAALAAPITDEEFEVLGRK